MEATQPVDTKRVLQTRLVEVAWKDPEFRQEILRNPKAMLEKHLGRKLPDHFKVFIHEEDANTLHFSLPPTPAKVAELSDDELEKVAGGTELWAVITAVAVGVGASMAVGSAAGVTKTQGGW